MVLIYHDDEYELEVAEKSPQIMQMQMIPPPSTYYSIIRIIVKRRLTTWKMRDNRKVQAEQPQAIYDHDLKVFDIL